MRSSLTEPDMVAIPGGTYLVGAPAYEAQFAASHAWKEPRRVDVTPFEIGRFAVTRGEYVPYLEAGGEPPAGWERPDLQNPRLPASGLSWQDAARYAQWLSERSGRRYRLPTAVEWEVAARGGLEGALFPWGNDEPEGRCSFGRSEEQGPEEVGCYEPNGYGIYDPAGGVWEWCFDLFVACSDEVPRNTPTGGDPRENRALRGGSFLTPNRSGLLVAYIHEDPPDLRHICIGMRLAREM